MHRNKHHSTTYTNSLSRHASLLLSASPTIINSPHQTRTNTTTNINNTGAGDSSGANSEVSSSKSDNNISNTNNHNHSHNSDIHTHNSTLNNTNNMGSEAAATDLPSSSTPLCASSPQQKDLLNNQQQQQQHQQPPQQQQQMNRQLSSSLLQPQASLQQRRNVSLGLLSASSQQSLASNLKDNKDNLSGSSTDNHTDESSSAESVANLNKSQGISLKKLDGIQRLVAAHSNYNKLYALNDFSGPGVGPKRPFELPPKLPPPPPWVPKVSSSDYSVSQWAQDCFNETRVDLLDPRPSSSNSSGNTPESTNSFQQAHVRSSSAGLPVQQNTLTMSTPRTNPRGNLPKTTSITIDSAISKLHQRLQQKQQQNQEPQQSHHLQPRRQLSHQQQQLNQETLQLIQQMRRNKQQQQQQQRGQETLQLLQLRQRNKQHQLMMQRQQGQLIWQQHRARQQQIVNRQQITSPQRHLITKPTNQQFNIVRRLDTQSSGTAQLLDSTGSRPISVKNLLSNVSPGSNSVDSAPLNRNGSTITSAQFNLLAQKIKETLETECANKNQAGNLSSEDKKKFQENLIALLKQEIAAVAKSANLKFNSPPANRSRPVEQNSFNLKCSPQTLFNTIRRETSLLLSRRERVSNQSTHNNRINDANSLLNRDSDLRQSYKIINRHATTSHDVPASVNSSRQSTYQLQQTVKIVIPPTEYYQNPNAQSRLSDQKREESENFVAVKSEDSSNSSTMRPALTYQVIRKKLKAFQDNNQIYLGYGLFSNSNNESRLLSRSKKLPQKSLDKIVDRLQAKCSGSLSKTQPQQRSNPISLQQRIINSSADLLRVAAGGRTTGSVTGVTPIPVFRSSLTGSQRGDWLNTGSFESRVAKSKKLKRPNNFGLKIANLIEREHPQPNKDQITVDQFAKCLNLVRATDIPIRRHREQLESEMKWKLPVSNRPLRLRRVRGERMPPSASYKATRKAGLQ